MAETFYSSLVQSPKISCPGKGMTLCKASLCSWRRPWWSWQWEVPCSLGARPSLNSVLGSISISTARANRDIKHILFCKEPKDPLNLFFFFKPLLPQLGKSFIWSRKWKHSRGYLSSNIYCICLHWYYDPLLDIKVLRVKLVLAHGLEAEVVCTTSRKYPSREEVWSSFPFSLFCLLDCKHDGWNFSSHRDHKVEATCWEWRKLGSWWSWESPLI